MVVDIAQRAGYGTGFARHGDVIAVTLWPPP
jgi:hypothetical protein